MKIYSSCANHIPRSRVKQPSPSPNRPQVGGITPTAGRFSCKLLHQIVEEREPWLKAKGRDAATSREADIILGLVKFDLQNYLDIDLYLHCFYCHGVRGLGVFNGSSKNTTSRWMKFQTERLCRFWSTLCLLSGWMSTSHNNNKYDILAINDSSHIMPTILLNMTF